MKNLLKEYWHVLVMICFVFLVLMTLLSSREKPEHKFTVTYSFLYTNGEMGFADSVITTKSAESAINEGKTYLMTNCHIMHPVLLNITELK